MCKWCVNGVHVLCERPSCCRCVCSEIPEIASRQQRRAAVRISARGPIPYDSPGGLIPDRKMLTVSRW
jgi:hypothetical protein